jgi:parvulin-like peptidyl-prolyl isomerase
VRRLFDDEERQQATVTALFIGAIVIVVLALIGAIALAWYNDNLRPLARVGTFEIPPQLLRDRFELESWRIARDQDRVAEALQNGEIDQATATSRSQALQEQLDSLTNNALENLIDIVFQSQLAPAEGITVTPEQVDELLANEFAGTEKRHMWEIVVEPTAADPAEGPTAAEQRAALAKAEEALAAINAGTDWATVAHQYSSGPTEPAGGDLGIATANKIVDLQFQKELFELPLNGTTGIVRQSDDAGNLVAYRIGRVTEILPAGEKVGLRDQLFSRLPEANVRALLTYEAAAAALHDKITNAALAQTPEQARIAVIYIEGEVSEDPIAAEGEVDYSEIVFAPNNSLEDTPPADDPAWAQALTDAQAVYDQLKAIADPEERKTKFAELAAQSDSDTGPDGGAVGFVSRDLPPTAIGDALFTGTYVEGDLVGAGPIKDEDAYYVLLFNERRASVKDRIQAVKDALAQPGADFNAVAMELSEGPEKEDGGEIGWLTKDQLDEEVGNTVFGLTLGQVSDPIPLGLGQYFIKLEEKMTRALDPDQIPLIRRNAFDDWYSEKKAAAEEDGTITRADDSGSTDGSLDDVPFE